jgi:hypothetical protein
MRRAFKRMEGRERALEMLILKVIFLGRRVSPWPRRRLPRYLFLI